MATTAPAPEEPETPAPAPAPRAHPSGIEQAVQIAKEVEEVAEKTKSPLLAIAVVVIPLIFGGGAVGYNGWNASAEAKAQFEKLTTKIDDAKVQSEKLAIKVDDLTRELSEARKELAAAGTRASAERHEERIRKLEEIVQERGVTLARLSLEIEALKRGK